MINSVGVERTKQNTASLYLKGTNMTGLVEFQVGGKLAGLTGSMGKGLNSGWLGMTLLRVLNCLHLLSLSIT